MIDLYQEFVAVMGGFEKHGIPYAVSAGMALAAHGVPRSTVAMDLWGPDDHLDEARSGLRPPGYTHESGWMTFAPGDIRRLPTISKVWRESKMKMRIDMSPGAVSTRLKRTSQLRELCLALAGPRLKRPWGVPDIPPREPRREAAISEEANQTHNPSPAEEAS